MTTRRGPGFGLPRPAVCGRIVRLTEGGTRKSPAEPGFSPGFRGHRCSLSSDRHWRRAQVIFVHPKITWEPGYSIPTRVEVCRETVIPDPAKRDYRCFRIGISLGDQCSRWSRVGLYLSPAYRNRSGQRVCVAHVRGVLLSSGFSAMTGSASYAACDPRHNWSVTCTSRFTCRPSRTKSDNGNAVGRLGKCDPFVFDCR